MSTGGVALGLAALWALASSKDKDKPDAQPPPDSRYPPQQPKVYPPPQPAAHQDKPQLEPQQGHGIDVGNVIKDVGSYVGTGVAIVGGIKWVSGALTSGAKQVVEAGTEVAAAVKGGVGAGVSAGAVSGAIVEAVGGSVFLVGIVLVVVMDMIKDAINAYHEALTSFLVSIRYHNPQAFFESFTAQATEQISVSKAKINLPPATIRQAALTSIFLEYRKDAAINATLINFYNFLGWTPAQRATAPEGGAVYDDLWGKWAAELTRPPDPYHRYSTMLERVTSRIHSTAGESYTGIIAPVSSLAELQAAAMLILGDYYNAAVYSQEFSGKIAALCNAAIQGWGVVNITHEDMARTLGSLVGWDAQWAVHWVTNASPPYPYQTWWLTDPHTGNRFAPFEARGFQLLVSVPSLAPGGPKMDM